MAESLMHSIGSALQRFVERHRQARMRSELLSLDDHALADIGLSRSDLEQREDPLQARAGGDIDRVRRPH